MAWYAKSVPRKSRVDGVYVKAYYWYANSQPIIVCKIRPRGIPTEEAIIKWLIKSNYKMLNDFWYILIHCSFITSSLRFWNGCLPRTQHPSGNVAHQPVMAALSFLELWKLTLLPVPGRQLGSSPILWSGLNAPQGISRASGRCTLHGHMGERNEFKFWCNV